MQTQEPAGGSCSIMKGHPRRTSYPSGNLTLCYSSTKHDVNKACKSKLSLNWNQDTMVYLMVAVVSRIVVDKGLYLPLCGLIA